MKNTIKKIARFFGPGFITGSSSNDPSGIATYCQAGALFGFKQLWTALISFPMISAIQIMSTRITYVTNKSLSINIKQQFSQTTLLFISLLFFIINSINIGANLEVMTESTQLLIELPFALIFATFIIGILLLEIFVHYTTYSRYLIFFASSLLSYVLATFFIQINWKEAFFSTLIPQIEFSQAYFTNITAILGTTIQPYMFFWQSNQELEEKQHQKTAFLLSQEIAHTQQESISGMFFANSIMWFIMVTAGSTLFKNGIHEVTSAAQVAKALKPLAGDYASLLFTLGIIGTGLLAIPILAAVNAYILCETYNWPAGISLHYKQAKKFYTIIIASVVSGAAVLFLPINSITLLYYTAVLNGILAPPLIYMILIISNNSTIMGSYINNKTLNIFGTSALILMTITALGFIISLFS